VEQLASDAVPRACGSPTEVVAMARRLVGLHLQDPIEISAVPRALGVNGACLDFSVGILLKPQSQALNTLNLHPGLDPGVEAADILNQGHSRDPLCRSRPYESGWVWSCCSSLLSCHKVGLGVRLGAVELHELGYGHTRPELDSAQGHASVTSAQVQLWNWPGPPGRLQSHQVPRWS